MDFFAKRKFIVFARANNFYKTNTELRWETKNKLVSS